jgi:hypothetical protein
MSDGGIAQRWRLGYYPLWIHTRQSIYQLTPKDRRNLSPIEKYDLWVGNYSFSATKHELVNRGPWRDPLPEEWEGFCNGARCAGLLTPEPKFAVKVQNPEGIEVLFSPADIKALLSASYFYTEKYAQLGSPSIEGYAEHQPNPVLFDLTLRYFLARYQRGFVIDTHLGSELWNETVVGYQRELGNLETLNEHEKILYPLATQKISIHLKLETLGEVSIRDSNKNTTEGVANGSLLTQLQTSYTLYLDSQNRAIDGFWANGDHVRGIDFVWFGGGRGNDDLYPEQGGNPYLKFSRILYLLEQASPTLQCAHSLSNGKSSF